MFDHKEYDEHERVIHVRDANCGLKAIIALHSTALGPAFGGCRMWPYTRAADALADALRLSRGMTFKSAICDLPYGGGKSVIIGDPASDKTPDLLHAMARAVNELGGRYIIADDVGTTLADLVVMREVTRHTAAASATAQQPLAVTAHGVYYAMRAAVEFLWARKDFQGLRVAVQGLGNVGRPLCERLHALGAKLVVSDVDPGRVQSAIAQLHATGVSPDAIFEQEVDVFSPCALGSVLDERTIPRLRARLVCGGANNQLAHEALSDALHQRGILYIPDYLANAGGVIDYHQESIDDSAQAVLAAVERIGTITTNILQKAGLRAVSPSQVAGEKVRARLNILA